MKFNSLILFAFFSFFLFSCDSGIKFDNPYDKNSDAYQGESAEEEDEDRDKKDTDTTDSEPEDSEPDNSDTTPEQPDNSDSTSDEDADTSDSTDDSGDSQPDDSDSTDDGDTSAPDEDADEPDEEPTTRTATCSGLPANASWHNGSSITQTFDGNDWYPPATGFYSETAVANECGFKCNQGYNWNGDWGKCFIRPAFGNICTGQTKCYNNSEEITCPTSASANFYGQDAQYAKLGYCYPQSFTLKTNASGENVVVDNYTGLEWQQVLSEETFTWEDAITHCENLNYGGHKDWRLPSPQELLTIANSNRHDPPLDSTYFQISLDLWTSQPYSQDEQIAFSFGASYGYVWWYKNKSTALQAMCVRGNELPKPVFSSSKISGDTIISDSTTGLIWQQTYETSKTWQEALKYCEDLTYAGKNDWRLPNKNELASLLNYDKSSSPYSDFPNMPKKWFWGSTTSNELDKISRAWHTNFGNTDTKYGTNTESKSGSTSISSNAIRCVRSERINDPCENHTCGSVAHSSGVCVPENAFEYSCACDDGYFWNGTQCKIMPECNASSGTPCKDSTSGLIWSNRVDNKTWQQAIDYCDSYTEDGLGGWHLPNIDELKTLLVWSKASSCKVSETNNCLTQDGCWTCSSCSENGTPASGSNDCSSWGTDYGDGRFSKFGDNTYLWSSSLPPNDSTFAWAVEFHYGGVGSHALDHKWSEVRCVR